ncbi:HD-GYP domain-containing protein [Acetobacterium bakii]|uniref:HD-GYP domain-containing protein n=1 Tax=Acetobacterium bakii TaxID=52689 RepID=UPI00068344F0|nr:HD domain-containing phosphohydrolase [Acetobacterium bakii]
MNNDEWKEMTRHPEIGYRILSASNEFLYMAKSVFEHQERWDGKGYPKGLKGNEISMSARIIAVADAYDAMTSDRAYRKGLSEIEAVEEIRRCSGTQFDPEVTKVFIEVVLKKQGKY